jgi:hypothetical protein
LQGGLSIAIVQTPGSASARLQDFYAVSVQARLCVRLRRTALIPRWSRSFERKNSSTFTAVVEALNAGVDLLLIAFDGAQFYRVFACARDAAAEGKLDPAMLRDS